MIKMKPSYAPETSIFFLNILLILISFFLIDQKIINYEINLLKYININETNTSLPILNNLNILFIFHFLFIIYSIFSFIKKLFLRFYFQYIIDDINNFLLIRAGIIKTENYISIKEIRTINVNKPSFWQLLSGVRTINIEADGVDGWDATLIDLVNYKKIKQQLFKIKQNKYKDS